MPILGAASAGFPNMPMPVVRAESGFPNIPVLEAASGFFAAWLPNKLPPNDAV